VNQLEQLTIEILIASAIQGLSANEQRDLLIATILALVEKGESPGA